MPLPAFRSASARRLLAAALLLACAAAPRGVEAQGWRAPEAAAPHVFLRTRTVLDAVAWRDLDGGAVRSRRLEQRLDLTWWSRTAPDVLGHTSFSTRFDANLPGTPTPGWLREEQLEPTLHEARVEVRLPAGARVVIGRQLTSSPFGAGTLDGLLAELRGRGLTARLLAGRRPDAVVHRLADWAYDPEATRDLVSRGGSRWLEGSIGWDARLAEASVAARGERAEGFADDVQLGAHLRLGPRPGTHATMLAHLSPRLEQLDRADASLTVPAGAHRLRTGVRYLRPRFALHNRFIVYPQSARGDLWLAAALRARDWTVTPELYARQRRAAAGPADPRTLAGARIGITGAAGPRLQPTFDADASADGHAWMTTLRASLAWQASGRVALRGGSSLVAWRDPAGGGRRSAVGSATSATVTYVADDRLRLSTTTVLGADDATGTSVRWFATADLRLPGARW